MYDISLKLYKKYKNPIKPATVSLYNNIPNLIQFNEKIKAIANDSLKKSIKNIEERYKDPNYKIKLALTKALNNDNNSENKRQRIKMLIGATTISFSLYLVYSFMKRYRT